VFPAVLESDEACALCGRPVSAPPVRSARAGEAGEVLALWAGARSSHATTPDDQGAIERLLGRDGDSLLVAERDGRLVGALIAAWDGWRGNMYRLAVEPGARRRGIATALVREGERRLGERGATRVTVLMGAGDELAAGLWAATGYEHDARIARWVKNL
jgi:ribosomal protein S18 acetylase RimI-like enzyme